MRYSYLTHLECSHCGQIQDASRLQNTCPACQAPLLARYDLGAMQKELNQDQFKARPRGMNRWHELLPVQTAGNVVTLGEGDTPLLDLPRLGRELGLSNLMEKDESFNPTGTFKARGQAAAVARAKELGAKALVIPTAGNAGGAMAAYASRAGLTARIYMPADTPRANIAECQALGAEVVLVEGLISDAARLVGEQVRQGGWFDLSTFKEPYRLEGKKVMGFELAEALGWKLPDVIVYPAGGGMGLVGIWKAFEELEELGWLEPGAKPRMVAVQAAGCAPVVQAFEAGEESNTFWENAHTLAAGLRVPRSYGDRLMMATLYQSKGAALAVSDEQILTAQAQLGRLEGIFAAPEGAATAAALPLLLERGWLMPDEQVVLLNTGTGLKYLDVVPPPDRSTGRDYQ